MNFIVYTLHITHLLLSCTFLSRRHLFLCVCLSRHHPSLSMSASLVTIPLSLCLPLSLSSLGCTFRYSTHYEQYNIGIVTLHPHAYNVLFNSVWLISVETSFQGLFVCCSATLATICMWVWMCVCGARCMCWHRFNQICVDPWFISTVLCHMQWIW